MSEQTQPIAANATSKTDSISVKIKTDDSNRAATVGEVNVVTKAGTSNSEVKNNPQFINGAADYDAGARINEEAGSEKDAGMLSDNSQAWQREIDSVDGNAEWGEDDVLPNQILQAINTSLTNRHKMRECSKETTVDEAMSSAEKTNCIQEYNHASRDEASNNMQLPTDNSEAIDTSDVTMGMVERSNEEEQTESAVHVEPRASFLHGVATNNKVTKPSAIYGPASDLFVSRSDSSSSDELEKSRISINVTVNVSEQQRWENDSEDGDDETETPKQENPKGENAASSDGPSRMKPKIPAKPLKQSVCDKVNRDIESVPLNGKLNLVNKRKSEISSTQEGAYYSTVPDSPRSITLVDHYAEGNIYHEVGEKDHGLQDVKLISGRESKLAALAVELEQVRHNNTKRQAPAPPRVPDPPMEDPPSCAGRISPSTSDTPHGFTSFRGESMAFSSASSTTSTSSQDTEAGYASWNIHSVDTDDQPKYSKSKSSFLLTQYSKCKMLAMGYAEDSARARKRFSLKKLLKIGSKEAESSAASFDPNNPNPKAWKYSDHFERPRAKLEIIHPMDLENKSVTVNPGFDSMHTGSMSSFSVNSDDVSLRNSVSSDYGSYYSDTLSPPQEPKAEVNYEYIRPHVLASEEQEENSGTNGSTSPTPSRSSLASQGSTLTSGSSKNGVAPLNRPPKPPPPPRAHSLLPGNKALKNPDGTFKFPVPKTATEEDTTVSADVAPPKPQAPKRQGKSSGQKSEYTNFEEQKNGSFSGNDPPQPSNDSVLRAETCSTLDGSKCDNASIVKIGDFDSQKKFNQIVTVNETERILTNEELSSQLDAVLSSMETLKEDSVSVKCGNEDGNHTEALESETESQITAKAINITHTEKVSKSVITRNKHPPITKAPARPPPIYSKPQPGSFIKNTSPWKTLEDSYLVLTASNRELLIKLVNQAMKKRKNFLSRLQKVQFQWSDFEIDTNQPSSVFAFGEKIACHATMPKHPEYSLTLVISIQQDRCLNENNEVKYPVFGQFTDYVPSELLDHSSETELESMQATVLVLDHSNVTTVECFTENLPETLTEENEKELCFIILQLIQSLKSLQAQGIESIDSSFQNIILAKSRQDKYHTLIFLPDNCYDEIDYSSETCKVSLCHYALAFLFQILKVQSEEFSTVMAAKFSCDMAKNIFETSVSLLKEEKAVSLSQAKTLFECFLWGVTKIIETLDCSEDTDNMLHRWIDIERCNFIKNVINDETSNDINTLNEYYSQFLIRTSVRNIREVCSYL